MMSELSYHHNIFNLLHISICLLACLLISFFYSLSICAWNHSLSFSTFLFLYFIIFSFSHYSLQFLTSYFSIFYIPIFLYFYISVYVCRRKGDQCEQPALLKSVLDSLRAVHHAFNVSSFILSTLCLETPPRLTSDTTSFQLSLSSSAKNNNNNNNNNINNNIHHDLSSTTSCNNY